MGLEGGNGQEKDRGGCFWRSCLNAFHAPSRPSSFYWHRSNDTYKELLHEAPSIPNQKKSYSTLIVGLPGKWHPCSSECHRKCWQSKQGPVGRCYGNPEAHNQWPRPGTKQMKHSKPNRVAISFIPFRPTRHKSASSSRVPTWMLSVSS